MRDFRRDSPATGLFYWFAGEDDGAVAGIGTLGGKTARGIEFQFIHERGLQSGLPGKIDAAGERVSGSGFNTIVAIVNAARKVWQADCLIGCINDNYRALIIGLALPATCQPVFQPGIAASLADAEGERHARQNNP